MRVTTQPSETDVDMNLWPSEFSPLVSSLLASQQRLAEVERHVLDNLGHEMRTPLTIIRGLTEMLLDEQEAGQGDVSGRRHDLEEILRACQRLHRITERGIGLARIKLGQLTRHLETIPVRELIREIHAEFADEAREMHLWLEVRETGNGDDLVEADGPSLEMALRALHENAIKFNHPGGSVCWEVGGDDRMLEVRITNTGETMSREQLESCLAAFSQGDASMTRRFGGLGLGLPLAREVVELHGGRLQIARLSRGQGTRLRVTLPRVAVVS